MSNRVKFTCFSVICFASMVLINMQLACASTETNRTNETGLKNIEDALQYLSKESDVYHARTVVYDDAESGGNRFFPSGWMCDNTNVKNLSLRHVKTYPHSGHTCIEISWKPGGRSEWTGIYWQYPENNWGDLPGVNLTGATKLTFWARGNNGGEQAEFKFGGIKNQNKKYSDSCRVLTTGLLQLTKDWQQYSIDLSSKDLSNVIGGFCWVTNAKQNRTGCTIYLDDIIINHKREHEPRLVRSYQMIEYIAEAPQLQNICYMYDNAVVISALISSQKSTYKERALLITDAFVELVAIEPNHILKNAYCCGDLFSYNSKVRKETRMPGRFGKTSDNANTWLVDAYSMSIDTGNLAWSMLALLNAWDISQKPEYIQTASQIGNWITNNCQEGFCEFGFSGGNAWDYKTGLYETQTWMSIEHNIDLYAAFTRLAKLSDDKLRQRWLESAESAKQFVYWCKGKDQQQIGMLVTGTLKNTCEPNFGLEPLDPQTWSVLAFYKENKTFEESLDWAKKRLLISKKQLSGYKFSTASSNIWPEGTAQMALALKTLGRHDEYKEIIVNLDKIQSEYGNLESIYGPLPGGYPEKVDTGYKLENYETNVFYYKLPHVGATAWYIMAKNKWNPFWGTNIPSSK